MDTFIRRATTSDFPATLDLIKEFSVYQKSADKVSINLEQMQKDAAIFQCFVAETGDNIIVGFASFFSRIIHGVVKQFTWMTCMLLRHSENTVLGGNY